jgi:glutathione peroxidase-family protein
MNLLVLVVILILAALVPNASAAKALPDENENCGFWASIGECQKNPNYMLRYCATSCASQAKKALDLPNSFYDIIEKDIHGNDLKFSRFRGKVVYLVNVASQCGYTQSNYNQIRDLQKYANEGLEIVLAPCNAFGGQEPGGPTEIYRFADRQGFNGIILSKGDVNGDSAKLSFQYLKHATGKDVINWNFDGKFLVDRDGKAYSVDSEELEDKIVQLLNNEQGDL